LRNIYQTLSYSELNYMHKQLVHLKRYKGKNDLEPGSRRMMAEFGTPAQIAKKTPVRDDSEETLEPENDSRQKKFIKKFGKIKNATSVHGSLIFLFLFI
jgi:hypothetical protein